MGIIRTRTWDAADHLNSEADVIAYLDAVLAENDPELTAAALNDIARVLGKPSIPEELGLAAQGAPISSNPDLGSVLMVLESLGLRFRVSPVSGS